MAQTSAADLQARMEQAVAAGEFELAARLRDEIRALGAAPAKLDPAAPPGSKIRRQVPGRMGLGTDQQVYTPPDGWTPPPKPDFLKGARRRRTRRD